MGGSDHCEHNVLRKHIDKLEIFLRFLGRLVLLVLLVLIVFEMFCDGQQFPYYRNLCMPPQGAVQQVRMNP